ncbi:hypothetical protein [Lysobacter silvisoli]|uniref:Uncharacterized protein n=1 Tax=Lysobacter silvisoli TaxID=2293254 RepID=A0A371K529_9GAMM|nr:hypothetical protein [Lysobacter silvisoli]RDZ28947.1 hypothetical protein DX914_07545 [Lysobacter silvisoli]
MTVDAFKELYRFHRQLHGIVRTLPPAALVEIGYDTTPDQQLLRDVFEGLARRLDPVVDACVWTPGGDDLGGMPASRRVH